MKESSHTRDSLLSMFRPPQGGPRVSEVELEHKEHSLRGGEEESNRQEEQIGHISTAVESELQNGPSVKESP